MEPHIYGVTEVNQLVKGLLDSAPALQGVAVRGELSNYKIYPSGHHYFTLKDQEGALRCVMFRGQASRLRFRPENGMKAVASGRITVFPRDGAYQLYCDSLIPEGVGDLAVAFQQLKEKLWKEGLFDPAHKKPLPPYPEKIAIVTSGAGAAAIAITKLLLSAGAGDVTLCDRKGAIYAGRSDDMNWIKEEMAQVTNPEKRTGSLVDVLAGADVFIGVSAPGAVTKEMVQTMNAGAVIFACANPTPEIFPDDAKAGGAAVVATGRSDYPNQINNVLAFPGIFRGALDARASDINDAMKIAAAHAIADLVTPEKLSPDYIIPSATDPDVAPAVAAATARAAIESGIARNPVDPQSVAENLRKRLS